MYLPTGFTIGNHLLYNYFMPDTILTKEMLARSRVIAKGRAIREVERLVRLYGGKVSLWLKKSPAADPQRQKNDIMETRSEVFQCRRPHI